jgi:hypothetical protein
MRMSYEHSPGHRLKIWYLSPPSRVGLPTKENRLSACCMH